MMFTGLPDINANQGPLGTWEITFESNIDHALWFVGTSRRNEKQKQILGQLMSLGISPQEVLNYREKLKEYFRTFINTPGFYDKYYPSIVIPSRVTGLASKKDTIPVEVEVYERDDAGPLKFVVESPPLMSGGKKLGKRSKRKVKLGRSTAEAYAKGIESLLEKSGEEIIKSLQDDPDEQQSKPDKKPKESNKRVSKFVNVKYSAGAKKAPNFNTFLGGKIMSAFKNAAIARKEFVDMGGSVKDLKSRRLRDRFITRALGFEFGGDAINRTKGTFSSSPELTQDPALTRGQRFSAGIRPLMSSTLPEFKATPGTPGDAGVAPFVENIDKSYSDILSAYALAGSRNEQKAEAEITKLNYDYQTGVIVKEALDIIREGQRIKKEKLETAREEKDLEQDLSDKKKIAKREKLLEQERVSSGTSKYTPVFPEDPFKKILDAIFGKKDGDKEEPGGGGNFLSDLLGFGAEVAGEELVERGLKRFFTKKAVTTVATKGAALGTGAVASIVLGAGLAGSGIGEGFFQLTKKDGLGEKTRDFFKKKGEETGGPLGMMYGTIGNLAGISNESTKVTGAALDAIGTPFRYAIEAIRYPFLNEKDREKQAYNLAKFDARLREYSRGWMNRIDFMDIVPDQKGGFGNIYGNDAANKEMMKSMAGDEPTQSVVLPSYDPDESPQQRAARLTRQQRAEAGLPIEGYSDSPRTQMAEGTAPKFDPPSINGPMLGDGSRNRVMVGEANASGTKGELVGNVQEITSMVGMKMAEEKNNEVYSGARMILGVVDNLLDRTGIVGSSLRPFFTQQLTSAMKFFGMEDVNQDTGFKVGKTKEAQLPTAKSAGQFLTGGSSTGAGDVESQGTPLNVSPGERGVLDLIASVEAENYDVFNQSRGRTQGKATEKTIQWLVDNAQGAIGRYQHMPQFLMNRARAAGYGPDTLFTPDVQDDITLKMLRDNYGLDEFLSGEMSAEKFAASLSPTWRGLPQGPDFAELLGGDRDSTYNDSAAGDNAAGISWVDSVSTLKSIQQGGGTGGGRRVNATDTTPTISRPESTPTPRRTGEVMEQVSTNDAAGAGIIIMPVVVEPEGDYMNEETSIVINQSPVEEKADTMKMLRNIIRERQ